MIQPATNGITIIMLIPMLQKSHATSCHVVKFAEMHCFSRKHPFCGGVLLYSSSISIDRLTLITLIKQSINLTKISLTISLTIINHIISPYWPLRVLKYWMVHPARHGPPTVHHFNVSVFVGYMRDFRLLVETSWLKCGDTHQACSSTHSVQKKGKPRIHTKFSTHSVIIS